MKKYDRFIFKNYDFNERTKILELKYTIDTALDFTETFKFDFDFVNYDPQALDRAVQNLFFMAGVSYFKTYVPTEIAVNMGKLNQNLADFFSRTYQRGLGEFWYVNNLDPNTPVNFPVNATVLQTVTSGGKGLLASVGGGKDSLVTIELLRKDYPDLTTWSLNHKPQLTPLVQEIGLPHYWVERTLDPQLQKLNNVGALNGHIPISAIFACVGTVVAILSGKQDVVMSNERSADEPTLTYRETSINHQYSKSLEFENDYQAILSQCYGDSIRYYSLLRPFSELYVSELFAQLAFAKYKDVFSSCNRAYVLTSDHMSWCGVCPKCAFTFLALTPFIKREELEHMWGGKNLIQDPLLENTYKQLLGIAGDKPLECVGEIKESRAAMQQAQTQYLDLLKYHFDLPANYDYKTLGPSSMPEEMLRTLISQV